MRLVILALAVAAALSAPAAAQSDPRFQQAIDAKRDFSPEVALELLETACADRVAGSCERLMGLYAIEYQPEKVRPLAARLCDAGDGPACFQLAYMAQYGIAGETDEPLQRESYRRACAAGLPLGCYEHAEAQVNGYGGDKDLPAAIATLSRLCEAGSAYACTPAGGAIEMRIWESMDMSDSESDGLRADAYRLFERGCSLGDIEGCLRQAEGLASGTGTTQDNARALVILEKACAIEYRACEAAVQQRFYQP